MELFKLTCYFGHALIITRGRILGQGGMVQGLDGCAPFLRIELKHLADQIDRLLIDMLRKITSLYLIILNFCHKVGEILFEPEFAKARIFALFLLVDSNCLAIEVFGLITISENGDSIIHFFLIWHTSPFKNQRQLVALRPTLENGLFQEELGDKASYGPDVNRFSIPCNGE